jgi:glycosyltransferase involved in cell wall biosynthesis
MASASIIVTSYNQCATIEWLLASLERQTLGDFEVIIADDGSSDGTAAMCAARSGRGGFALEFVTQPDEGYRKSKIVNEAVRRSRADYLIFVDGDVILERHFVEDHLGLRKRGGFICGRRVDLGPEFTRGITLAGVRGGEFDRVGASVLLSAATGDTRGVKRALRITSPFVREKIFGYGDGKIDLLGSNMSLWKADLVAVNGFNEALEAYWGEDGDLFIRMRNSGKTPINGKGMCVQFHVFHERRAPTPQNQEWYSRMLEDRSYVWAAQGLSR